MTQAMHDACHMSPRLTTYSDLASEREGKIRANRNGRVKKVNKISKIKWLKKIKRKRLKKRQKEMVRKS